MRKTEAKAVPSGRPLFFLNPFHKLVRYIALAIRCIILHYLSMSMKFSINKMPEYQSWLDAQAAKFQGQVEKRLAKIEQDGYFGNVRWLGDGLFELKFNNGCRIYYARTGANEITLILGGNKNGQNKDIAKAKKSIG